MAKKTATEKTAGAGVSVTIAPPRFQTLEFTIRGTAPLVQNKFSAKARQMMKDAQEAGSTGKKGKKKEPKDFHQCYLDAMHTFEDGGGGIPATAFRNALISACRMCNFAMTRAKLSVFVEADGFSPDDMTPLVRITKGEPRYHEALVRVGMGTADIRPRPMWEPGWEAVVRVRFDLDQFTISDVTNLFMRAGMQVGIGEGRPDSKGSGSAGMGWGMFELVQEAT